MIITVMGRIPADITIRLGKIEIPKDYGKR